MDDEPWHGIAVVWWPGARLMLLVDAYDAWVAWDGQLMRRVVIGLA